MCPLVCTPLKWRHQPCLSCAWLTGPLFWWHQSQHRVYRFNTGSMQWFFSIGMLSALARAEGLFFRRRDYSHNLSFLPRSRRTPVSPTDSHLCPHRSTSLGLEPGTAPCLDVHTQTSVHVTYQSHRPLEFNVIPSEDPRQDPVRALTIDEGITYPASLFVQCRGAS
jgi:hypothetical protein